MKRALSILLAALLLLAAVPTVAEEGALKAGLYISEAGTEYMYLNEEGVGVLNYVTDNYYASGVVWTETSLEIERTAVPYAIVDGVLSFTYDDIAMALRYSGIWDAFALGDQGTEFAGDYAAEDGRKLTLSADGRGVYRDAAGEKAVFWGSLLPYWNSLDGVTSADCFVLFDSYLSGMTFGDGVAVLEAEGGEEIVFSPAAAQTPEQPEVPAAMTLISPAFDLSLTLPAGGWTVEETEAGLLATREQDMVQYTFLSVALEKEPSAATLDAYADLVWTDALMGAGVAYEAADTVRGDHAVGEAQGRTAATEWTADDGAYLGDAVLWFANGRLYVALCASREDSRAEALEMLDEALLTFRTAEEASQARPIRLPMDKAIFEMIREMPQVAPVSEQVYYGYKMSAEGESYEVIPILMLLDMDPRSFSITMRSDGTGTLCLMDAEDSVEFTWTEDTITAGEDSISYTREGDHLILFQEDESVEFVPEAEFETLLAKAMGEGKKETVAVVPTAEELLGTWTFTKAIAMGIEVPAEEMGTAMSLVFNDDGSAIMLMDGAPVEYAWTMLEDGKVSLTVADEEAYALIYDGTALTVDVANALEMIFERDN